MRLRRKDNQGSVSRFVEREESGVVEFVLHSFRYMGFALKFRCFQLVLLFWRKRYQW